MSTPRIHGMRTYDDWKLATPPEYDELGPEPCECEGRGCPECDPEPEPPPVLPVPLNEAEGDEYAAAFLDFDKKKGPLPPP